MFRSYIMNFPGCAQFTFFLDNNELEFAVAAARDRRDLLDRELDAGHAQQEFVDQRLLSAALQPSVATTRNRKRPLPR
jgi:hypothetical protein